ncbi:MULTISPECIES: CamS family sex pheromone protein [Bacillaceae]|uniref:Protein involved in sex pheromone biosynthesis n=1 Tax=Peribacillus huizhouensis TaxID=1501239 RepID=A0ABR6CUH2_9BACI|nr:MULTISPECIES: CamS family sex pheromone protein [Bacillaceae]MBA9028687.1 protein involved in sex pheromone biosynthesis [Peribacillus huizhouensis]
MKNIIFLGMILALLLSGCAPKFDKEQAVVSEADSSTEKAIVPNYQISKDYYKTMLPFEESNARGLVVSHLNTRYDIEEFETGLMRIAQKDFSPDNYFFREGQILKGSTITKWLRREYTEDQLKEKKLSAKDNLGLNPIDTGKGDIADRSEKSPIYLAHILEHDYLVKNKDNTVSLGGVVIGLALNSVYYYQKEAYGATYETKIKQAEIEKQGKAIAEKVVQRLRENKEMSDVPITIALFEQKERSSVVPGNFLYYSHIDGNKSTIGKWEKVDEEYYLFPSTAAEKAYRDDVRSFKNFKQDIENYFPNFNGVVGRAFYVNKQLQELNIDIPIQFYGNTEAIGFTQYVTGLIMNHFNEYISIQISITSVNGPEALITRKPGDSEPYVHIYK